MQSEERSISQITILAWVQAARRGDVTMMRGLVERHPSLLDLSAGEFRTPGQAARRHI